MWKARFRLRPTGFGGNDGILREQLYDRLFNIDDRWSNCDNRWWRWKKGEEERVIHDPRFVEEETDEKDDELIEMMLEYMCDRVEIDEVTHEEEAEKPKCAICIEGLHFVEEDGVMKMGMEIVLCIVYHVPTCFTLTVFQIGFAYLSHVPFAEQNFRRHSQNQ